MGGKKAMQLAFDFQAVGARRWMPQSAPTQKKERDKGCLNCGGEVKAWSKFKRICAHCKRDPEWRSAAKGLADIYSVDLRPNRKGKS